MKSVEGVLWNKVHDFQLLDSNHSCIISLTGTIKYYALFQITGLLSTQFQLDQMKTDLYTDRQTDVTLNEKIRLYLKYAYKNLSLSL